MKKPCTTCGNPRHAYCKDGYVLGHPKFFGAVIGKCEYCNSLIGSASWGCDNPGCQLGADTIWAQARENDLTVLGRLVWRIRKALGLFSKAEVDALWRPK